MSIWRLKKGAALSFRQGHPWVLKGDLEKNPSQHPPGTSVLLQDEQGKYLSWGYGNPLSHIVFRSLLRIQDPKEVPLNSMSFVASRVLDAWKKRIELGYFYSYRLCFAEADGLPGLVIDRYTFIMDQKLSQVLVVQITTQGMEALLPSIQEWINEVFQSAYEKAYSQIPPESSYCILRRDMSVRKKEGLALHAPSLLGEQMAQMEVFKNINVQVHSSIDPNRYLEFSVDLVNGQKTGFFLDQSQNIRSICLFLQNAKWPPPSHPFRILDLCCYVGQWTCQILNALLAKGLNHIEIDLLDVSSDALERAKLNIERISKGSTNIQIRTNKIDIFQFIHSEPNPSILQDRYNIIIADPPALIKNVKDRVLGVKAYQKLNVWALSKIQKGLLISCSCSGLLSEDEFRQILFKALLKTSLISKSQWLFSGKQALDHPQLLSFPEGTYLKMLVHYIQNKSMTGD